MTVANTARRVPFREGVFSMPANPGEPPRLNGVRCTQCGDTYLSRRSICLGCGSHDLRPCLLPATGRVATFTIVHQRPPGAVIEPPYAIVQVALDDGPNLTSALVDVPLQNVRVGLPVEMTLVEVRRDDEGNSVVAHAFRPIGAKS